MCELESSVNDGVANCLWNPSAEMFRRSLNKKMQCSVETARLAVSLEISAILRGDVMFEEIINRIAEQFWMLSTLKKFF